MIVVNDILVLSCLEYVEGQLPSPLNVGLSLIPMVHHEKDQIKMQNLGGIAKRGGAIPFIFYWNS